MHANCAGCGTDSLLTWDRVTSLFWCLTCSGVPAIEVTRIRRLMGDALARYVTTVAS